MIRLRYILILAIAVVLASCSVSRRAVSNEYPQIEAGARYEGVLEECIYRCSVDGPSERRALVYLPQDYHQTTTRYPVLYLLHGARGNELSWIVKGNLLHNIDSLTHAGLMQKTIVVLPNINQYNSDKDYGKSRIKGALESFFENDGVVEFSFVEDVVKHIDNTYRTIPEKCSRAIAGLSIGAMRSIHISASYPDVFDYVGLFSPMVRPCRRHSDHSSFYNRLRARQREQFASPPKLYWIMIGKRDFFYLRMRSYDRCLTRNGFKHEYFASKGGHQWYNWVDYCNLFMQRLWQ